MHKNKKNISINHDFGAKIQMFLLKGKNETFFQIFQHSVPAIKCISSMALAPQKSNVYPNGAILTNDKNLLIWTHCRRLLFGNIVVRMRKGEAAAVVVS